MKKLPNFFVVGAPKCGTTSLYHYFYQHPEIYLSPIKEPVYFAKDIVEWNKKCRFSNPFFKIERYLKKKKFSFVHIGYITKVGYYLELFREVKDEKAIGEMAVLNLFSKVAAKEIYSFNPEARIIIILRNPIDRAFSHFLANLRDGKNSNKKFLETVIKDFERKDSECKYYFLEMGFYYAQVKRYLDIFPEGKVRIVLFDDLKKDTCRVLKELFEFIGVNSEVNIDVKIKKNESFPPKYPKLNKMAKDVRRGVRGLFYKKTPFFLKKIYNSLIMEREKPLLKPAERRYLLPFFKEDILKTQGLIGKDLSHWLQIEKQGE